MDGDIAPLAEIAEIAEKYNAMFMVDEAHSTGIFGPDGRGLVNELKLEHLVNAEVGTFSKALGGYGGFVACSKNLKKLLVNKARSFIYTTALPPVVIGSALGAIKMLLSNPRLGTKLLDNAAMFRGKLQDAGLDTANSQSQIIPIIIGDTVKTLSFSNSLKEKGILAIAIRPPSVPKDTSRLRLSVTLGHSRELLEETAGIIIDCARQEGVI
jgi:7-keto-8-aminopelargonate synthetase-like enzyme